MTRLPLFLLLLAPVLPAQPDSAGIAEHLALGAPAPAFRDLRRPSEYLLAKTQYVLSYHRFNGTANWVAWHTDSMWLGTLGRSNDFRADSALPAGWYRVHERSFRRSGYDRGHLCPSGDRTNSAEDNSATFVMTNMIPQAPNNNQGPWAQLEIFCRELVMKGKELYIAAGGWGSKGFLDSGRVNIPMLTWKTVLVLDAGENDAARVTRHTPVIAVVMPNDNALIRKGEDWRTFRVTADSVEALTGFDLFSAVPDSVQRIIEARRDAPLP